MFEFEVVNNGFVSNQLSKLLDFQFANFCCHGGKDQEAIGDLGKEIEQTLSSRMFQVARNPTIPNPLRRKTGWS